MQNYSNKSKVVTKSVKDTRYLNGKYIKQRKLIQNMFDRTLYKKHKMSAAKNLNKSKLIKLVKNAGAL